MQRYGQIIWIGKFDAVLRQVRAQARREDQHGQDVFASEPNYQAGVSFKTVPAPTGGDNG